jgi:hypothetical protein
LWRAQKEYLDCLIVCGSSLQAGRKDLGIIDYQEVSLLKVIYNIPKKAMLYPVIPAIKDQEP